MLPRRPPRLLLAALAAFVAVPAAAWTPASQQRIAEQAARLAPPDFYRQLARHRAAYLQGTTDPFKEGRAADHFKNPDGGGRLDEVVRQAIADTIATIRAHRPFPEICYRAGVVSHYLADANNPLNSAAGDPAEVRYFADFLRYLESVEPRVEMVFYGFRGGFAEADLPRLVAETLGRSRRFYPLVGREYRRVGFAPGALAFDDRSTAYAVASLAYSHAISDIAEALRYIWLAAGGIDARRPVPRRGRQVVKVPRPAARPQSD